MTYPIRRLLLLITIFGLLAPSLIECQSSVFADDLSIPATDEGLPGAGPIRRYDWFQNLWTTKEFPADFILKLEFRATPNADSGVFIRRPQLQCRDYPLAGPYKELKNYKPQDWNQLVITVNDNVAHCTCNGEVLEAEYNLPETGPIGLEGDRGQMEYRHIQLKELP